MTLPEKIRCLLNKRNIAFTQLRCATSLSRATMSRIMCGHTPSPETLARIAEVLEVSPGYLRGGYQLPAWLSEEDIMFLVDRRNVPLLKAIREAAGIGITAEELERLIKILTTTK